MKKTLIGLVGLALLASAVFIAAPATVDLEVAAVEGQTIPVSGWIQSDRDPRVNFAEIPTTQRFRTSGFAGEITAPEKLVVRGTVRKAGLQTMMFEARGRDIELEGRWAAVEVTVR